MCLKGPLHHSDLKRILCVIVLPAFMLFFLITMTVVLHKIQGVFRAFVLNCTELKEKENSV